MSDNDPHIDDVFGQGYRGPGPVDRIPMKWKVALAAMLLFVGVPLVVLPLFIYTECRIEVPSKHMAILIRKVGTDLPNGEEIAPDETYKGVQKQLLAEGRYFYNPYFWNWIVTPQIEIPEGKLGVRTRLYGDDLPPDDVIAWKENQKGIVPDVLRPGRHAINAKVQGDRTRRYDSYAEMIELFDPVTVPAGFKGVVTKLSAPVPTNPNVLIVEEPGTRGVQQKTLDPGTYYVNPYITRIDLVDCRSQRFNLTSETTGIMGFPSKDGFWVILDGVVEFRVKPEDAARVFVTYNDSDNGEEIDEEIVSKVILPNARSFCRLRGSSQSGRDFISGETRAKFQEDFQAELAKECESQGIEVIQALITSIRPPEKIADPVRKREFAVQEAKRYEQEIKQQLSEQQLATQKEMVKQKPALVSAEQEVVRVVTEATRKKEVALIEANQRLKVAEFELKAAQDEAAATLALGKAKAEVIQFDNQAEAAGWKRSVEAFSGDGNEFARWTLLNRLAPAFKKMMVNTADSPLMDIFKEFSRATGSGATVGPGTSAQTPIAPARPVAKPAPKPILAQPIRPIERTIQPAAPIAPPKAILETPAPKPEPVKEKPPKTEPAKPAEVKKEPSELPSDKEPPKTVKPKTVKPPADQPGPPKIEPKESPKPAEKSEDKPAEEPPTGSSKPPKDAPAK